MLALTQHFGGRGKEASVREQGQRNGLFIPVLLGEITEGSMEEVSLELK